MTEIYIAAHGDKFNGPNPGMTEKGFEQIKALRHLIPKNPSLVICGTGRRHLDVAKALNLNPDRYTSWAGDPDSMEIIIGGTKIIILADGALLEPNKYTSLIDNAPTAKIQVAGLPDKSVVCSGRPLMIMLGRIDARSAAVYKVTCKDGCITEILEVVATGEIDPALT